MVLFGSSKPFTNKYLNYKNPSILNNENDPFAAPPKKSPTLKSSNHSNDSSQSNFPCSSNSNQIT